MTYLTLSVVQWVALSLCAALWLTEHVRLALQLGRTQGRRVGWIAALVPGAGPWIAFRAGARSRALAYVALVVSYAVLRFVG